MKLNMGCGKNKLPDYINVDAFPYCKPDIQFDLETFPWPWEDNSVDAVMFNNSLEHMGGSTPVFLSLMQELYRICRNGAEIEIHVPHPRSDNFIGDPTHVRVITPQMLSLFDKQLNDEWALTASSATPLAHYLGVNFKITHNTVYMHEPYHTLYYTNQITIDELSAFTQERNNVLSGYFLILTVIK